MKLKKNRKESIQPYYQLTDETRESHTTVIERMCGLE